MQSLYLDEWIKVLEQILADWEERNRAASILLRSDCVVNIFKLSTDCEKIKARNTLYIQKLQLESTLRESHCHIWEY